MLKRTRTNNDCREATQTDQGRTRFERGLLAIMGPAQLGEDKPREGYVPDEGAYLCHKCGQPWDVHGRIHTANMTYRPCPPPRAEEPPRKSVSVQGSC